MRELDVEQRRVGSLVVDVGVNREKAAAIQHGLVRLDQPHAVKVVRVTVHGDRAFVAFAGLADHVHAGAHRRAFEVGHPGVVRIQRIGHAFDPAFGQLRPYLRRLGRRVAGNALQ